MRLQDGNKYAIGNYKFGEMFAKCALDLIAESGIDKQTISLIG
jgi:hypothetical protein